MSLVTVALTDRYELLEPLGGTGLVAAYRARDRSTGGFCTVKVPRAHLVDGAAAIGGFRDLLLRVRALQHPHILSIREVGGSGGDLWIVTDLADAPTLKELVPTGIALGAVLETVAQAAEALGAAHQAGLVHGDIRPGSILIYPDGSVRVADFGMGLLARAAHPLMRTSLLTPLPAYLAPEVARGQTPTPQGDIYALGMLLYQVATGHLPFPGYNTETVRVKQEESTIPPPSLLNPDLPPALDGILAKALAWRPEDRYPLATVLAAELRSLHSSLPATQAALLVPPAHARTTKRSQSRATDAVTEAGSRLCPACSTPNRPDAFYCSACWRSLGTAPILSPAEERSLTTAFRRRAWRRRLLRRSLLLLGLLLLAGALFYDRSAPPGLLAAAPASTLSSTSGAGLWASPRGGATGAASLRTQESLPTGAVRWQRDLGAEVLSSPAVADGRIFVTTQDRRILALDAQDGRLLWTSGATGPLDVSPVVAGDLVYVAFRDSTLVALDVATGAPRWQRDLSDIVFTWVAVDQGILYVLGYSGTVQTLDAQTGQVRWVLETGYKFHAAPAVAQGRLVAPTMDGRVFVLNGRTGSTNLIYLVRRAVEGSAAITGDIAVFGGGDRTVRAINIHARNLPVEKTVLKWWAQSYIWGIAPFPPAQSGNVWGHNVERPVRSSPAVAGNRVFVAREDGVLFALSLTDGSELWRARLQEEAALPGSPIVVNDVVYVGTAKGALHALDATSGQVLWRLQASGPILGNAAYADGTLYLMTKNGVLYALD